MKKIPTVYVRDFTRDNGRYVTDEVTPGCEWVLAGEGVATRKYDGTCVMFDGTAWWARREVRPGKTAPSGFVEIGHDDTTGKTVGWEPASQSPFGRILSEAVQSRITSGQSRFMVCTYELCGPKISGKRERTIENAMGGHFLQEHPLAERVAPQVLRDLGFNPRRLVRHVATQGWEGIVWHRLDGWMAKLKARDLRPTASETATEDAR